MIPAKDLVGRYGGDEFIAVIYDTDKERVADILAQFQEEDNNLKNNLIYLKNNLKKLRKQLIFCGYVR